MICLGFSTGMLRYPIHGTLGQEHQQWSIEMWNYHKLGHMIQFAVCMVGRGIQ